MVRIIMALNESISHSVDPGPMSSSCSSNLNASEIYTCRVNNLRTIVVEVFVKEEESIFEVK